MIAQHMHAVNYTPIDIDDVTVKTGTTNLMEYVREHTMLVFVVSALTIVTVLVLGVFTFTTIRERQITQASNVAPSSDSRTQTSNVRAATDIKRPSAVVSVTLTRPPTRTPTITRTPTPSLMRPPTHTPAITVTHTPTSSPQPSSTPTSIPSTATPTYTISPSPTHTPSATMTPAPDTPTPTPTITPSGSP